MAVKIECVCVGLCSFYQIYNEAKKLPFKSDSAASSGSCHDTQPRFSTLCCALQNSELDKYEYSTNQEL